MPKLTAVIIAKNEEEQIRKCLDSLKSFVDEIVVVDDCSTDKTVDICKSYGAKVVISELKGNFANQRNIGIDSANSEWIIQMDADEIVPHETAKKITESIKNAGDCVVFQIQRKNFLLGYPLKYVGVPDVKMKIFKKKSARYIGNIHETLKIQGAVGTIEAEVLHYPYTSLTKTIAKMNFYSDVLAKNYLDEKGVVFWSEIKYRLVWKFIKHFWKLYVRKRGYRDGMHGFIWCVLNTLEPQIMWLKIWEQAVKTNRLSRADYENSPDL